MVGGYRIGMHFLSSALRLLEPRSDDDIVDRLHYLYTSTIILMFALLVSAKQYVGHPIECFVPAQFTRAMEQYTESYCWVQNTYFVAFQDLIPHRLDDRERKQIGYYQWVPFVFAIAAIFFHVPSSVWRLLAPQSGLNVALVVQLACQEQNIDPTVQEHTVDVLARHIDDALKYQRDYGARKKSIYLFSLVKLGKFYGAYVSTIYVFIKCLFFVNSSCLFILLNRFLQTSDYPFFGFHVLYDLFLGREWRESGKFPRVTLCDFEIRVLGNVHRHTVQCVLVINMFTEKIFIFLWLWLLFLSALTALNLLLWATALSVSACRSSFVKKFLECESDEVERFADSFLRPDGLLLLHMIASHGGNIVCARVTEALWTKFLQRSGKGVLEEKIESAVEGVSRRTSESWKAPPSDSSWHEPSLPPPMPALPSRTHYV